MPVGTVSERIGPIKLSFGVTRSQALTFLGISLFGVFVPNLVALLHPFVLTEQLKVPTADQGRISGSMAIIQHAAVLLFIGIFGTLADRYGRRAMMAAGLIGMAVVCFAFPLAASVAVFFALRFCFGVSTTAFSAGGATLIADLPDNSSRGKFISLALILQSLASAVFLATIGANILSWLTGLGLSMGSSGRAAFWGTAVIALIGASIPIWFFKFDRKSAPSAARGPVEGLRHLKQNLSLVLAHARSNARFGLVLLVSFVLRSDSAVVTTFLSLWIVNSMQDQGSTIIEATAVAGVMLSIMSAATVCSQPICGFLVDRMNRTAMLLIALLISAAAFTSIIFVSEFSARSLPLILAVALIGIAEGTLTVAAQSIFGQEAPEDLRGSAMGIFIMTGTISVLVVNLLGGILYDTVSRSGPFLMIAALMYLFATVAFWVVLRRPGSRPKPGASHAMQA